MTQEERNAINPELCAEGLHQFLKENCHCMNFKQLAVFHGAISLLYDCHPEEWYGKGTKTYCSWWPFDDVKLRWRDVDA